MMTPLVSSTAQSIWDAQAGPAHAARIAVGAWQRAGQPVHRFQAFYALVNQALADHALEQMRTGPKPSVVAGHLLAPYRSILPPDQVAALEADFRARMPEWSNAPDWPAQAAAVLAGCIARVTAPVSGCTVDLKRQLWKAINRYADACGADTATFATISRRKDVEAVEAIVTKMLAGQRADPGYDSAAHPPPHGPGGGRG